MTRRFVVGVGGASGALYAQHTLAALRDADHHVDLVFTKMGRVVWNDEIGTDPKELGVPIYSDQDFTAPFASGSCRVDGMVVVPCSAGCLARIATGVSTDLVSRAGDVMLKEKRPLVLVLRETPLSLVHLRAMVAVAEAGAIVLPASPSFYSHPTTLPELVDTVVCRVLDHLGVVNERMPRWDGNLRGQHS